MLPILVQSLRYTPRSSQNGIPVERGTDPASNVTGGEQMNHNRLECLFAGNPAPQAGNRLEYKLYSRYCLSSLHCAEIISTHACYDFVHALKEPKPT
jgi:hypothetical protein